MKALADRDPDCYVFACAGLIGATPELLIQREGRQARSRVIAGTAARGSGPDEDAAISTALAACAKEAEEHRYAVESVSQALAPLCHQLAVEPRPAVIRPAGTHHLATIISGTLARDASALKLAGVLHPPAAGCGTPPGAAMDLIREPENLDPARSRGPGGWLGAPRHRQLGPPP